MAAFASESGAYVIAEGIENDELLELVRESEGGLGVRGPRIDGAQGYRLGRLKLTVGGLRARDEIVFTECAARAVPVAVSMSGGYAHDIDAIVTIHANTIDAAIRCLIGV